MTLLWLSAGIAIGALLMVAIWAIASKKNKREIHTFDEGNISELIGKIQHVTSVNVDTLEKKIKELKVALRQANATYIKLNEAISDAKNVSVSVEKSSKRIKQKNQPISTPNFEKKMKDDSKENLINDEFSKPKEDRQKELTNSLEKMKKESERINTSVRLLSRDEKILDLKSRGWSVEKIAESLNMGVGEVSLIIEMNSRISK
ncbi:DUF6115 domain-containing protein [Mesoaciditoga lauensis]|uniref:DUF6115 domain-containing protein n=1 Tax=Mesoaciditoga lauensis TaxID=1495039 RepID=UPI00055C8735|nr:hypothetical protein [Mesoaciditoga lauensis]